MNRATIATLAVLATTLFAAPASAAPLRYDDFSITTTERPVDVMAGTFNDFTIGDSSDDPGNVPELTTAGSHASLNLNLDLCPDGDFSQCTQEEDAIDLRDLRIDLPAGMVGNPQHAAICSDQDFYSAPGQFASPCPTASVVGWLKVPGATSVNFQLPGATFDFQDFGNGYLVNLTPHEGEVARLGAIVFPPGGLRAVVLPVFASVRTDSDYGITTVQPDSPPDLESPDSGYTVPLKVAGIGISVFGYAGDPRDSSIQHRSFLTLPTSCTPAEVRAGVTSWDDRSYQTKSASLTPTGCTASSPPFTPTTEMATDDPRAGAPSGQTVTLKFPDSEDDVIHQSHLRRAEVTLPEGVALSPGAAIGLRSCSDAQFAAGSNSDVACPDASAIGDVSVDSPVLDGDRSTADRDPLAGKVYFGQPLSGDRWRLFLLIEAPGLRIKLVGSAQIDAQTGRISNVFDDLPQLPFTSFSLHLNGGERAILTNPRDCGTHTIAADLTPWNGSHAVRHVTGDYQVDQDCGARGFSPTLSVESSTKQAGAAVESRLEIDSADGAQRLRRLDLALPPGLVGSLAAAPLCSLARAQQAECDESSEVGSVVTSVGTGGAPLSLAGKIYIAEPSQAGDAATLAIAVPSKVGPIDLGNVVVLTRVKLRQSDGAIVATTGLPTIFEGVPLSIRDVKINIDRKGFLRNPTGCDVRRFTAGFGSDQGATSSADIDLQATGCDQLGFSPRLDLIAGGKGATDRFAHTGLKAIVSQPAGQANITTAHVRLPTVIKPDTVNINKPGFLCSGAQIAARACPAKSLVGHAVATSPLLPRPLTGPIYDVQPAPGMLPNLVVLLDGQVALELDATNRIENFGGLRIANEFAGVPDVPVTRFELNIDGGPDSILKNGSDLCAARAVETTADATFTAHSGASSHSAPKLRVEGCSVSVSGSNARMTSKGTVAVPISCRGEQDCAGTLTLKVGSAASRKLKGRIGKRRFRLAAGESGKVSVKLSKRARRHVIKRRKLGASVSITGATAAFSLTIKAPSRHARHRR